MTLYHANHPTRPKNDNNNNNINNNNSNNNNNDDTSSSSSSDCGQILVGEYFGFATGGCQRHAVAQIVKYGSLCMAPAYTAPSTDDNYSILYTLARSASSQGKGITRNGLKLKNNSCDDRGFRRSSSLQAVFCVSYTSIARIRKCKSSCSI